MGAAAMPTYLIRCRNDQLDLVARRFLVLGTDPQDAVTYLRSVVKYPNPRLQVGPDPGDLTPTIVLDARISEV
jgi:hypothetical protein